MVGCARGVENGRAALLAGAGAQSGSRQRLSVNSMVIFFPAGVVMTPPNPALVASPMAKSTL
eukprot:1396143-Rhodomonas_salina.1